MGFSSDLPSHNTVHDDHDWRCQTFSAPGLLPWIHDLDDDLASSWVLHPAHPGEFCKAAAGVLQPDWKWRDLSERSGQLYVVYAK